MAALADEAAADAHAGARVVAEANDGRSVGAFASYWRQGPVARIDSLTEAFKVAASALFAMTDHVTDVKPAVIWELEGLLDELARAKPTGAALADPGHPSVTWVRQSIQNRLGELGDRLVSETVRLQIAWRSGGNGLPRSRLADDHAGGVIVFDPPTYEQGARRIVQAAEGLDLTGDGYGAMRGRTARQLRQWAPTTWAATAFDEIETEFADMIRCSASDLRIASDSLLASRFTLLKAETTNAEMIREVVASLPRDVGRSDRDTVPVAPGRINRILSGYADPGTRSPLTEEDPFTGFHRGIEA